MIDICEECDEFYCEVCRVEEERKWATHFANDRSSGVDVTDAYEADDYKGWDL